jgi:membrane protease YdiL (CAAX protease family)
MQTKPAYRAVNLLFLGVLCLQLANFALAGLPQYVRLILNEALFVFLPAYLYLRFTHQPLRQRVRWRWPGWKVALLSLLVGMGLYPASAVAAALLSVLFGYTSPLAAPDAIPTTLLMGVLAVVAYAGMAPLCEEFLFRGVIQPVYTARGPRWAVLFVGLLFVVFHLALVQGISILLLALALGFVNDRARSLPASMLTHFGANFLAALVLTQGVFHTGIASVIVSAPALIGGLLLALASAAGLFWLTRRPPEPLPTPAGAPLPPPAHPLRLSQAWPLLAALLIYLPMLGAEVYYSRSPQLSAKPLALSPAAWTSPQSWRFEIRNPADTRVGDGDCQLTPAGAMLEITCHSTVAAYEVTIGKSYYSSSGGTRVDFLRWQAAGGRMQTGSSDLNLQGGSYISNIRWTLEPDRLALHTQIQGEAEKDISLPLDPTSPSNTSALLVVSDYTWPWQLAGIDLTSGVNGAVLRFTPLTWREKTHDSGPLAEARLVTVTGPEAVTTPAGKFSAWKVTLGNNQVAWYAADTRTLVKFNNGVETWSLEE